ncbi:MAG: tryptophan synthase subunit alpha [Gemmatales bacterium]
MPLLDEALQKCKASKRPAFIPFITAGDPSLEQTGLVIDTLVATGADVIEIGIPYSDPLADGPVIQASYTRALNAKTKLADIFTHAATWTQKHKTTPFLAMGSYSIVFRMGVDHFLDAARQAGFAGLIIPDLPHEEAATLAPQATARQLALIQLVTPTTSKERAAKIAQTSTGFLYVVSVTGITGARTALPTQITNQLSDLRQLTTLPLCVGFGISTKEHVQLLKPHVDGLIVGSALVKCLEGDQPFEKKLEALSTLAKQLHF